MSRPRLAHLKLALPMDDYRVYRAAARILARLMGERAPDVVALIAHELTARKPRVVADEYLYFIGWGMPGRSPLKAAHPKSGGQARPAHRRGGRQKWLFPPASADPGRNGQPVHRSRLARRGAVEP